MNDTLKAAGRIGTELGAAKAENEKLRGLLQQVVDCQAEHYGDGCGLHLSMITLVGRIKDALSQQAEPATAQDEREAADDAAYAAVVDGGWSSVKEMGVKMFQAGAEWVRATRPAQAEQEPIRLPQRKNLDGLLDPESKRAGRAYNEALEDVELLNTPPIAQTAPQPVSSALADLAGDRFEAPVAGWSAPAQDERKTFEAWAKTQGDKWLIVGGLQWSAGTDDYASARTNAALAAWQERAALSARPAQTEQQPAYVECRECTGCGHVGINDAHPTDATCAMCDWSGPSPVEDQCPDCGKENAMGAACPKCSGRYRILAETHVAAPIAQTAPQGKFRMGDLVKKSTGSEWVGRVVGWYSTEQTKEGYAVESSAHRNSVQIYPAKALEAVE